MNLQERLLLQKRAGIITETEYREYNEIISYIDQAYLLNEGFWENAKYALSKLGRYKAGGKIFGKGKVDAESAVKVKDILNMINEMLNGEIEIEYVNPEFTHINSDYIKNLIETIICESPQLKSTVRKVKDEYINEALNDPYFLESVRLYPEKYLEDYYK